MTEANFGANYVEESLSVSQYGLSAACVCSKWGAPAKRTAARFAACFGAEDL